MLNEQQASFDYIVKNRILSTLICNFVCRQPFSNFLKWLQVCKDMLLLKKLVHFQNWFYDMYILFRTILCSTAKVYRDKYKLRDDSGFPVLSFHINPHKYLRNSRNSENCTHKFGFEVWPKYLPAFVCHFTSVDLLI